MSEPRTFYGVELDPVPERPTREQALAALDALASQNLRWEYVSRHKTIVHRFIEQSCPHEP